MREKNIGFIFWAIVFGYFCCCSSSDEDNKSRQTFVIRYKDGEQTIPVTVVLDHKKQMEYVINMNPRTPAKSVTLYDFKQRTIAYKDLTNRECFLGRLTHETLNEEISALQDVKNPVEVKPKVRSLDPRRPALTPTEIRNIAGQKTAVFCRKMNTWLLMPDKAHGISKREVDEFEERTLQLHGHQTSHYSHYERETRRRYRNRNQASNARRRSHRNKSAADNENGRPGFSEPNTYHEQLNKTSDIFAANGSLNIPEGTRSNYSSNHMNQVSDIPYPSPRINSGNDKESETGEVGIQPRTYHSNLHNTVYPNHDSRSSSSNAAYFRPFYGSSDYLSSNETDGSHEIDHEKIPISENTQTHKSKDISGYFEQNRPLAEIVSSTTELSTTDIPREDQRNVNYPNVHPSLVHLLPLYKPLGQEFDFGKEDVSESGSSLRTVNRNNLQNNIESESHPSQVEQGNKFIHFTSKEDTSHDPDVSINVLEIPRISKEFENFNLNKSYVSVPQSAPKFPHLVDNYPSEPQPHFKNTPYPHRTYIDNVHSGHSFSFSENGVKGSKEKHLDEDHYRKTQTDIPPTTVLPIFTTTDNFVTDRTVSNTIYVPSVHTAFKNSEDFSSFQIFPSYIHYNNSSLSERNSTLPHVDNSNTKFIDENRESIAFKYPFTTKLPGLEIQHKTRSNHRSDIPSEDSHGRSFLSNSGVDASRNTYAPFSENKTDENIPPHRVRYQNALRDFKPDEIVIDLENVPTHTLPPVTPSFQQNIFTTIRPTVKTLTSGVIRSSTRGRKQQVTGNAWGTFHPTTTRYPRRRANSKTNRPVPNGSISHPQRVQVSQNNYHAVKPEIPINQFFGVNRYGPSQHTDRRQFYYPSRVHPPSQVRMPAELNELHHLTQLTNLPPGVSVHPRHPQAPLAEMVHSNRPPTMPLPDDSHLSPKPHRQRHHRKKDSHQNSCCRLRGRSGAFQFCCRNGGPCCSKSRRPPQTSPSCCSSPKAAGHVIPANAIHPPVRTTNPIMPPTHSDDMHQNDASGDRCQKEKMCRTLYESTRQVMVCRHARIEGC